MILIFGETICFEGSQWSAVSEAEPKFNSEVRSEDQVREVHVLKFKCKVQYLLKFRIETSDLKTKS